MYTCRAPTETATHYLFYCRLYSVQRAELLDGVHKLDSTLQNHSEDQLLTVLLHSSEKFALNVNKEIIRLINSYLKGSERFVQPIFWPTTFVFIYLFVFIVWLYGAYCKWLYLTRVLSLVSSTVLGIIFHIYCCIASFINSTCKDPWYIYIYKNK